MNERAGGDFTLLRRLFRQARPYWPHIGASFVVGLLATPIALLTPVPLKIAVDELVGGDGVPGFLLPLVPAALSDSVGGVLVLAAGMVLAVALLSQLVDLLGSLLRTYTGERLVLDFRGRLFRQAQRLSLAYHDRLGTSDSVYRIQWDTPAIRHVCVDGLVPLATAVVTLVAMVYVTALIDWHLALVALAVVPPLFLLSRAYRQPLRRRYRDVKEIETSALGVLQEALSAIRVVKAFGAERREEDRFVRHSGAGTRSRIRLALFQSGFDILMGAITAAGTAVVLFVGGRHVQSGQISIGELLIVMAYLTQLYAPLRTISGKAADIQASLASAERAFALLDRSPEVTERANAVPLTRARGAFSLRGVSFAYDPDRPVIRDVSLEIPAGARVGIAGRTGAGKTTFVSLLSRFYDPSGGGVQLDGVDLRDYRLADLRNQFAIVLQEPLLFSTTIEENIAYGRDGSGHGDVVEAARAAGAHDFISALPQGYETLVGERGMLLSGGERQRIALARAFLRDAPILLLDEPTSSIDTGTESTIMEALDRLMAGRTTFMIAHRLGTLDYCDLRLEVADGHVREVAGAAPRTADPPGAAAVGDARPSPARAGAGSD